LARYDVVAPFNSLAGLTGLNQKSHVGQRSWTQLETRRPEEKLEIRVCE